MSINGRNQTIMSFRLPDYLREEITRTADKMEMSDSNFLRVAITNAIMRYAREHQEAA
jgi:predicted transcriptional regulator